MTRTARLLALASLFLAATSALAADAARLARVNGVAIPAAALERAVTAARAAGQADTPALRKQLAQQLVAEELFWQEARKQKLHTGEDADRAAENARRQYAIAHYLQGQVIDTPPDEAALRQRHQRVVARLGKTDYRLSLIQTPDLDALRAAAQRLANGADFAAEARNVSHAPSAPRGGALTWYSFPEPAEAGRTNGLPLPIARVLPTLTPGATSSPILLDDKSWALIRLDETRPTQIPDYAATRPALLRAARAEAAALAGKRLADRLLRDARIEWAAGLDADAGASASGEGGR